MAIISPGVFQSILFASAPTATTRFVPRSTATTDGSLITKLQRIYRKQRNWKGIEELYLPIVEKDSTNIEARIILSENYFLQQKNDKAKKYLIPVLKDDHFRPAALELLGRIEFEDENYAEALNYFTLLTQEYPDDKFGWIFSAIIYNRNNDYEKSVVTLQSGLNIFPNDTDLLGMYGNSLDQAGRSKDAIAPLKKVLSLDSTDVGALGSLAAVYDKLKMWNQSDSLYRVGLVHFPENALLLNNFGYSLCERGVMLDSAREMSEKALKLEPDNGAYLDTYGWINYRLGDYEKALEYIQKALKVHEDSAEVLEHLGDVYFKLGNKTESARYWRNALEKDPSNTQLEQKIRDL